MKATTSTYKELANQGDCIFFRHAAEIPHFSASSRLPYDKHCLNTVKDLPPRQRLLAGLGISVSGQVRKTPSTRARLAPLIHGKPIPVKQMSSDARTIAMKTITMTYKQVAKNDECIIFEHAADHGSLGWKPKVGAAISMVSLALLAIGTE